MDDYLLRDKPTRCPNCGSGRYLETGLMGDDDEFDYERAEECGFEDDGYLEWQHPEFTYMHEHMHCERCGEWRPYGRRWYYDEATNSYTLDAPETPKERLARELREQEAAGQQRLAFD